MGHDGKAQAGRVVLARHGRTRLNAAGVLRGHLDPPLDAVGREEVARLGAALAGEGVALIVASPLLRAVETAQAVADRAGAPVEVPMEVEVDPRLIDRDYGRWAGGPKDAVVARWGSLDGAPDVEQSAAVIERARAALEAVAERAAGRTAVAVSHDVVNRLLIGAIDATLADRADLPQATGCYNVLERRGAGWKVLRVGVLPGPETGASERDSLVPDR